MIDTTYMRDQNFVSCLPTRFQSISKKSVAELSGTPIGEPSDLRSYVVETSERAWGKALDQLTCEEARMLVSQKMGLEHIGAYAAEFVFLYPAAEVSFYAGDFSLCLLRSFDVLLADCPNAARRIEEVDHDKILEAVSWSKELRVEAADLIQHVQSTAI